MALERLDKILSSTGRWSRKEIKDMIRHGRVRADGTTAAKPEEKFDPASTHIQVDGQTVDCAPFVYVLMHKPAGLLSATRDPKQKTVLDLLPQHLRRRGLFPVGRLDKDTTGLLLLTDDGPLGDGSTCLVTLREGKYHQVKRMLAARGKPVTALHRLSMGPLKLEENLKPGQWRMLTEKEIGALRGE